MTHKDERVIDLDRIMDESFPQFGDGAKEMVKLFTKGIIKEALQLAAEEAKTIIKIAPEEQSWMSSILVLVDKQSILDIEKLIK